MRNTTVIERHLGQLDEDGALVVNTSLRLLKRFPALEGACYRYAFFLRLYLKERFGLDGKAVIGFVNDGTDNLYSSHAWYKFRGRITDLAISAPLHPEVQLRGPLTIHGIEFEPGHPWTYHRQRPDIGNEMMAQFLSECDLATARALQELEAQHRRLTLFATNDALIRNYLDGCTDGWTYSEIAAAMDGPGPFGRSRIHRMHRSTPR
jgi:hypothetical protein